MNSRAAFERLDRIVELEAQNAEYYALSKRLVGLDRQLWFDDDIATIRALIEITAEFSALNAKVEGRE